LIHFNIIKEDISTIVPCLTGFTQVDMKPIFISKLKGEDSCKKL